jgi:hypothetical protein
MTNIDQNPTDETVSDVFDVNTVGEVHDQPQPQPLYRIYEGSKVAISKSVGKVWKNKVDAAKKAYDVINNFWEEAFRYYNNSQNKANMTPRGVFHRGDGTENIVFSNLNIMLSAIYSRDPDITCTTTDDQDEPFTETLEALLNTLIKRRDLINAKPKIKKAAGIGLLTNFGIFKLDWTSKDDSREFAQQEMQRISDELKTAEDQKAVEELYGQLEALESNMEVLKSSGPSLSTVMPHNLIIDPYAEQPDGLDGSWMAERVFLLTSGLIQRYTKKEDEEEDDDAFGTRVLVYKPTHKAVFADGVPSGQRDDGLGVVMQALDGMGSVPVSFEEQERRAYINMYFTECWMIWDKALKRVMLFHRDDWAWPLWVWEDPLGISQFFPYYIISYIMSTGGTVSVGETAYILDQQDEINDMNRKLNQIRRSVFDYILYDTNKLKPDEAEKFIDLIEGRAATGSGKRIIGVDAGEGGDVSKAIAAYAPPQLQYEQLFNKKATLDAVDRITNTSDALRGVQFKTNTNVASVESYQESMKLNVGAKVDVIEDAVAAFALSLAELSIQRFSQEDVEELIGKRLAAGWQEMTVEEFTAQYNVEIIAGSMEKPNSTFRKKEAVQLAQAVGQFAKAAPGVTLKIMLRAFEAAFTDIVIKKEDWDLLDREIQANIQKGVSTQQGQPGQQLPPNFMEAAQKLAPADQQQVVQMHQQGQDPQKIIEFIQQKTGATNGGGQNQPNQ